MKIDIAGVLVDNVSKQEAIEKIDEFVKSGKPHFIVTPYSELVVFAQKNPEYKEILNKADLSLPDGIGILWAAKFLSLQVTDHMIAFWQLISSLISTLLNPNYPKSVISERVIGSHLIWDIAKLASDRNYSLALIGGKGAVAAQTAEKLKVNPPAGGEKLKVNLVLSDCDFNDALVEKINQSNSDILLIAYSPPKQEIWLAENIHKLKVKVGIGLGGTFDYVAKRRLPAPKFMHYMGLEWLWRLVTQPYRIKRMWNAVPVFIWKVYKYKIKKV